MRPIKYIYIIFFYAIFTSCDFLRDDDYSAGTMQAQIDGELIIFDEAYGDRILSWETGEWSGIENIIGKTNYNVSGSEIQLRFPFNPQKGTIYHPDCMYRTWVGKYYDYNNLVAYNTKRINPQGSESSSSITFTSVTNNRYKGTFYFTAYSNGDSVIVTNGKFDIDSDGKKW